MIDIFTLKYPSVSTDPERKVYVYTPRSYKKNPDKKYPVLYMFDGHNAFWDSEATFGRSWRLGKFLDKHKIDLIVVGVDCNHGENDERSIEYSPFNVDLPKYNVYFEGKGDNTMKWFAKTLRPYINRNYRTLRSRNYTYLMGSSMGGLMAVYGLLKYNKYFSKAAALSPAYQIYRSNALKYFSDFELVGNTVLYTDYGTNDLEVNIAIPSFIKINSMLIKRGVSVTSRIIPEGSHCEACWEKQLIFAINTLIYNPKIEN